MKDRWICVLLAVLLGCLPGVGLGLEMTELPETFEELCAQLPPLPQIAQDEIAFFCPSLDDFSQNRSMMLYCDAGLWPSASGLLEAWGLLSFAYDADQGAYVLDEPSDKLMKYGIAFGPLNGFTGWVGLTGRTDENGWQMDTYIFFDFDGMIGFFERFYKGFDAYAWSNVTDFSTSGYIMPMTIARMPLDNGSLEIWQFADHSMALLLDDEGSTTTDIADIARILKNGTYGEARQIYPEHSQYCQEFTPILPEGISR